MDQSIFKSLVSALELADSSEAVKVCCHNFSEAAGIPWFLVGVMTPSSLSTPTVEIISNYPDEWMQAYLLDDKKKDDPVVTYILSQNTPVIWSQLVEIEGFRTKENLELMRQAAGFGLKNGLSIPLRNAVGNLGVFSLALDTETQEGVDALDAVMPFANSFASSAFNRLVMVAQALETAGPANLTERQKECLFWAAEGKTTWEIAQILDIKERTVEFHLVNSAEKLGASNRQHAVSIAVQRGIIKPKLQK